MLSQPEGYSPHPYKSHPLYILPNGRHMQRSIIEELTSLSGHALTVGASLSETYGAWKNIVRACDNQEGSLTFRSMMDVKAVDFLPRRFSPPTSLPPSLTIEEAKLH